MKVLVVASGNRNQISPFVKEQGDSLKKLGLDIEYFLIKGKGVFGYLKNYFTLTNLLKSYKYDLIHAHYGLSGLLTTLQSIVPVIITFHGSDVNLNKTNFFLSYIASRLSDKNIFVHKRLTESLKLYSEDIDIIPCGVNLRLFKPMKKERAKKDLGLDLRKSYILFSSSFENKIKNAQLAKSAIKNLKNVTLIELKGYSRKDVKKLMNAVDILLITSFSETGPLVVKEALACNCPIISTDVGDVKNLIQNVKNCHLVDYNKRQIVRKIKRVLSSKEKSNGRRAVKDLDLQKIAIKIDKVYQEMLKEV